ncbi:MAG: hypothetical protein JRN08_06845 [Nitrososphaerota archaeon]|nr:hypothetical protein [Nitrososphaerota archaeon]
MGATVSGTVVAGCEGEATAQISSGASYKVHCTQGTAELLFSVTAGSSSYPPGSYTVTASFDNGHGVRSSASSQFAVVSGQSSGASISGIFYPASLSVVALAFLVMKKQRSDPDATPRES